MKIRIEVEIGSILIADEHCMPDSLLGNAILPRALLDQIEAGLWNKMSVAVHKALDVQVDKVNAAPEPPKSRLDCGRRFDVA